LVDDPEAGYRCVRNGDRSDRSDGERDRDEGAGTARPPALVALPLDGGSAAAFYVAGACVGALFYTGELSKVAIGFLIGAVVMAIGGVAEILFGVNAEGKSLESITEPLSAAKRRIGGAEVDSGQEPPAAMV